MRLPVSVQNDIAAFRELHIGICRSVELRSGGNGIPADEITIIALRRRQRYGISVCNIEASRFRTAAGIEHDLISIDRDRKPLVKRRSVTEAHSNDVVACLRKADLRKILSVADADRLAVVDADFIILRSDDRIPGENVLRIRKRAGHLKQTKRLGIAPERICPLRIRTHADRKICACRNNLRQVKTIGVRTVFLAVNANGIGHVGPDRIPDERRAGNAHVIGRCGRRLLIGVCTCNRRIISLRARIDAEHNAVLGRSACLQAIACAVADVDLIMCMRRIPARHRNDIAHRVGNGIPVDRLRLRIEGKSAHLSKFAVIDKFLGNRGYPSVCLRRHRELDPAFRHRAACEIVICHAAERDTFMVVIGISALDRKIISFRVRNPFEDERRRLDNAEYRDAGKRLVVVITRRQDNRIVVIRNIRFGRSFHRDGVFPHLLRCKIIVVCRRGADILLYKNACIGTDDRDTIGICAGNAIPRHAVRRHADFRSGKPLGVLLRPKRIKRRVLRKRRSCRIFIRQFVLIVKCADVPSAELISVQLRHGKIFRNDAPADRRNACGRLCIVSRNTAQIKIDRVLTRTGDTGNPVRIQRHVRSDRLRSECKRLRILFVRIPADKDVIVERGIGRTGNRFSVQDCYTVNSTPPLRIKCDGIVDLFQKAHGGVVIRERQNIVCQRCRQLSILILREIKDKRLTCERVCTGLVFAHNQESKLIAVVQGNLIHFLGKRNVVVIYARFRSFLDRLVLIIFLLACRNRNQRCDRHESSKKRNQPLFQPHTIPPNIFRNSLGYNVCRSSAQSPRPKPIARSRLPAKHLSFSAVERHFRASDVFLQKLAKKHLPIPYTYDNFITKSSYVSIDIIQF